MNSYHVEVPLVSFKDRIFARGSFFIWGMTAQLVIVGVLALSTQMFFFIAGTVVVAIGLFANLLVIRKEMKFYLLSLKVDGFNKVYLTFDLKGETKAESYELKDFNLIIEDKPTRNINHSLCTMALFNKSQKIFLQHAVGEWNKEKFFEVSKAVSGLKY